MDPSLDVTPIHEASDAWLQATDGEVGCTSWETGVRSPGNGELLFIRQPDLDGVYGETHYYKDPLTEHAAIELRVNARAVVMHEMGHAACIREHQATGIMRNGVIDDSETVTAHDVEVWRACADTTH